MSFGYYADYNDSDYNSSVTESEILKKYNYWYKNRDSFLFNRIGIMYDEKYYHYQPYIIKYTSIPDSVVIYNKYLTTESIYDNDDYGQRNLLVCFDNEYLGDLRDTSLSNCFFYDYDIGYIVHVPGTIDDLWFGKVDYPISSQVDKVEKEFLNIVLDEIKKYKDLSKDGEDAYFIFMRGEIRTYDYGPTPYWWHWDGNGKSNILNCKLEKKVIKCSKSNYLDILEKVVDSMNNDYWLPPYDRIYNKETYAFETTTIAQFYYDTVKQKKYTKYDEIDSSSIIALSPIFPSSFYSFDEFKERLEDAYIVLNDINPDTGNYYYDNDTLEKAYNEIFAIHGHDFKSKELKDYFSLFDWYKPIPGKTVQMSELSKLEQENAQVIKSVIDKRKNNNF